MYRFLVLLSLLFVASAAATAAPCRYTAIVAKDTGNLVGYFVQGDTGTAIVQNAGSIAAACRALMAKPVTQV